MTVTTVNAVKELPIPFDKAVFRHRLLHWYDEHRKDYPWRQDWQQSGDPYRVWLSEVMLQQTVIKAVLPAYKRFTDQLPTLRDLALADPDEVKLLVRGLGYYRRFGLLKKAADQLVQITDARSTTQSILWPATAKEWSALPGIGPYTAAALASITNNESIAVVDGNVERVLCRLFNIQLAPNLPALKPGFKRLAQELIAERPGDFNQAVMELGQQVCRVSKPLCLSCPVSEFCQAKKKNSQDLAPQPKIKRQFAEVNLQLYLSVRGNKIGLTERPAQAKFLRGTWGFVTGFSAQRGDGFKLDRRLLANAKPVGRISHNITHHKIKAEVFIVPEHTYVEDTRWLDSKVVEEKLISNLDRKAWHLAVRKGLV